MRGDGVVEDVDEDWPHQDERVVGDDDDLDFAFREGSSSGKISPTVWKRFPRGENLKILKRTKIKRSQRGKN